MDREKLGALGKMLFLDEDKQKEWDDMEPSIKRAVLSNLQGYTSKMTTNIAIETLAHAINELSLRIDALACLVGILQGQNSKEEA